jgi:hypothetical protein
LLPGLQRKETPMKARIRALLARARTSAEQPEPPRCSVCRLPEPERAALDSALAFRRTPLAVLARQFGPSKAALWRHAKNHLAARTGIARKETHAHSR